MQNWITYPGTPFDYAGDKLIQAWDNIHAGNQEPLPDDPEVLDVWRNYHEGKFAAAVENGKVLGGIALIPAAFAATIYAQYLEPDDDNKANIFLSAIELSDAAVAASPNSANAHYIQTVAQGPLQPVH